MFSLKKKKRPSDPPGKKTGGYELKMAFKYVSESQQEPVTIKKGCSQGYADRMEFPFNATLPGWAAVSGFPVVSALCV